jgi:hypothetical protein
VETAAGQGERVETASLPGRLAVSILALGAVAAPLVFRSLDDNRLTSWRWVFAGVDPIRLYALVAAGIVLAHLLARSPIPGKRPAALLLLAAYATAAIFWGQPEVIVDASRIFTQAKQLEIRGLGGFLAAWGREIPAWTDLPLVPLLFGLVFDLLGESRIHVQALTTLLFAGAVALTFRLGRDLWDEEVGFLGGMLMLAIPYLLTQVPGMLADVPTMFFLTLAIHAVVRAFQRGGAGRILFASLAVVLALLSKYTAWLLLSVVPVIGLVHLRGGAPRPLRTGAAIGLLSGSIVAGLLLSHRDVFSGQLALLVGYQAPGLSRWGESFASTFLFQVHPFLTAAAAVSLWMAIRRRDARYAILLWPFLLLVALQVRRIRYLIPAFPMLTLMAAYGLQSIRAREVRRLVVACAVTSSLVVARFGYLPFLERNSLGNLKAAGEYLDAIGDERVEVFTPLPPDAEVNPAVAVPLLDLFTHKTVIHRREEIPPSARERAAASPLRFTWEVEVPGTYAPDGGAGATAVAVVSDDVRAPLPDLVVARLGNRRLARVFDADEGVFRFRTMVRVYREDPGEP